MCGAILAVVQETLFTTEPVFSLLIVYQVIADIAIKAKKLQTQKHGSNVDCAPE